MNCKPLATQLALSGVFSVMCDNLTYILCILGGSSKKFVTPGVIQKLVLDPETGVDDIWYQPAFEQVICVRSMYYRGVLYHLC